MVVVSWSVLMRRGSFKAALLSGLMSDALASAFVPSMGVRAAVATEYVPTYLRTMDRTEVRGVVCAVVNKDGVIKLFFSQNIKLN